MLASNYAFSLKGCSATCSRVRLDSMLSKGSLSALCLAFGLCLGLGSFGHERVALL